MGANALLVDEDTCATNFMIRDNKMMQLVAAEKEPITPFVRVVRSLYEELGVSTLLVIGGVGDYFDVADQVLLMDCYHCEDVTARAKEIVHNSSQATAPPVSFGSTRLRYPITGKFRIDGKVRVSAKGFLSYGDTDIDLSSVEQIVSVSQTNAIAGALQQFASLNAGVSLSLSHALEALDNSIDKGGLDALAPGQFNGALTRPRLLEIGAALNRLRRDGSIIQR
jgi:predicted ABC-class ATPase